jgi:DNA polymerase-3 subunit epsilon
MSYEMLLLGFDVESTWTQPVNPRIARPTEIGAVLYCTETRKPLKMMNELVHELDHPQSPKELVELTGITDDMKEKYGIPSMKAMSMLNQLIGQCDYVVAHNGNVFDKVIYEEECSRVGIPVVNKPWIDTKTDVPYPDSIKTTKLTYLCAEHGFANPFQHRALFDVLSMLRIVELYDINEIVEMAKQPNVTVVASVSYQDKDLAKQRGYHWDGENKRWKKQMKEKQALKEKEQAPFPVQVLQTTS